MTSGTLTSGWASPVCATPRPDPVPPQVSSLRIRNGALCVHGPSATLEISAADGIVNTAIAGENGPRDPSAEISGIAQMRVSTDLQPVAGWQPFAMTVAVQMGALTRETVVVRLRDGAGNESADQYLTLSRCSTSSIDRGMLLEEQAAEAARAGDLGRARQLVRDSIVPLEATLDAARKRIHQQCQVWCNDNGEDDDGGWWHWPWATPRQKNHHDCDPLDRHVVKTLTRVLHEKHSALILLRPMVQRHGLRQLNEAIEIERDLATFADEHGMAL
jgi:hypothetical protein